MEQLLISEQDLLNKVCSNFANKKLLAVDTEFVRTRTLYPKLGLLQICDGEVIALIDPIAVEDLSPVWQLLEDDQIVKVLHACSEDLEVFLHAGNCKPQQLIDSQIMMSFLGHGISVGYAAMVKHFLDVELDKSESRTDWTKRPLTEKQLKYAGGDVYYLYQLFPTLLTQLDAAGWLDAAWQESDVLIERKFTPIDENALYQNVKLSWRLRPQQLNRLKHLAAWRYQQAQKRDLPLGFVAKDPTLLALAEFNPKSVGYMASLEGADTSDIRYKGKAMLHVLKAANEVPESDHPDRIVRLDQYPGYKQTFKKLKQFLTQICSQADVSMEVFASKKQMNRYLSWFYKLNGAEQQPEAVDLIQGWRAQILGDKLAKFADNGFNS